MGWSYSYGAHEKNDIKNMILGDLRDGGYTVIKHSTVGSHFWLAVSRERVSFVLLCLLGKSDGVWGYKDMTEDMGPYFYDCPQSIIKAVGPTANPRAQEWRAKVETYHQTKKRRAQALKALKIGDLVEFVGIVGSYRVTSTSPLYGIELTTGNHYRLPKNKLKVQICNG